MLLAGFFSGGPAKRAIRATLHVCLLLLSAALGTYCSMHLAHKTTASLLGPDQKPLNPTIAAHSDSWWSHVGCSCSDQHSAQPTYAWAQQADTPDIIAISQWPSRTSSSSSSSRSQGESAPFPAQHSIAATSKCTILKGWICRQQWPSFPIDSFVTKAAEDTVRLLQQRLLCTKPAAQELSSTVVAGTVSSVRQLLLPVYSAAQQPSTLSATCWQSLCSSWHQLLTWMGDLPKWVALPYFCIAVLVIHSWVADRWQGDSKSCWLLTQQQSCW